MRNIIDITDTEILELLNYILGGKYKIINKKIIEDDTLGPGVEITFTTRWQENERKEFKIKDTIILYQNTIDGTYIQDVLNYDFPHGVQRIYQEFLLFKNFKESKFFKV